MVLERVLKPTLKSLAEELSVDPSLISRVLRGVLSVRVSAEKRALILETAARVGYRPDRAARSLKLRSSKIVAMLTPDITNPFHSLMFRGAESVAQTFGYSVLLCHVADEGSHGEATMGKLADGLADGVLVACGFPLDPRLQTFKAAGLPYVLINRPTGDSCDVWYGPDDYRTGELGAEVLCESGHTRLIALFGDQRLDNMRQRRAGFLSAVKRLGLLPSDVQVFENVVSRSDIQRVLRLASDPVHPYTGLFVPHSALALATLEECWPLNIKVPEHISIMGYCGEQMSRISGVYVPAERMGSDAMRRLLAMLDVPGLVSESDGLVQKYAPSRHAGFTVAEIAPRRD